MALVDNNGRTGGELNQPPPARQQIRPAGRAGGCLGCRDGDGNIFIVDEHAARLWLPQRHAAAIKAMRARHKIGERKMSVEDLKRFGAGADVFSRQSDGTTIAAQYANLGISRRCANTDRVNGWAEMSQRSVSRRLERLKTVCGGAVAGKRG